MLHFLKQETLLFNKTKKLQINRNQPKALSLLQLNQLLLLQSVLPSQMQQSSVLCTMCDSAVAYAKR